MNNHNPQQNSFVRAIKKFFLSAFLVISFIAYALENRSTPATGGVGLSAVTGGNNITPPTQSPASQDNNAASSAPTNTSPAQPPANTAPVQNTAPTVTPAPSQLIFGPVPTATAPAAKNPSNQTAQKGQYKDGTYTGPEVDVDFGLVQVQAVVQNGKITNVRFLEYPSDRRTSQRINSFAVPELQQEAIQAQSANVNLISGATLTSEGFQQSLQAALSQARNS